MTNVYFHYFIKLNTTDLRKISFSVRHIDHRSLLFHTSRNFFKSSKSCAVLLWLHILHRSCHLLLISRQEKYYFNQAPVTVTSRFSATSYHVCWWVTVITRQKHCEFARIFDDTDISLISDRVPFHTDTRLGRYFILNSSLMQYLRW